MNKSLFLVIVAGLLIRILLNGINYSPDAQSFVIWAKFLTQHRLSDLYVYLPNGYLPYPPFYYYILGFLGKFMDLFNIWQNNWLSLLFVKLPVFFADVCITLFIYKISLKWCSRRNSVINSAFYFLNPSVIYIISIWGQIDSLITFLGLVALLLFINKKYFFSLLTLLIGSLIKLQMLTIVPLLGFLNLIRLTSKQILFYGGILMMIALIIFIPLVTDLGFIWNLKYFWNMPNQYPYTSIYAYNLWSPLGFLVSDKIKLLSLIDIRYVGLILFGGFSLFLIHKIYKSRNATAQSLLFSGYLLFFAFAFFSTRIHSRYLIYTIGFFAPFFMQYPTIGILLSFLMLSNLFLPNHDLIFQPIVIILNNPYIVFIYTVFAFWLFLYSLQKYLRKINK